ncbi:MAG TPA: hypothetical protein VGA70_11920 [Longimicrobiales bacterium]|jgi:hypothetical protein
MRHWIGLTLAGMAVALVYLYPPRSADDLNLRFVRERPSTPAGDLLLKLDVEARGMRSQIQRTRWSDSLRAVLAADREAGRFTSLGLPSQWSVAGADSARSWFDDKASALEGGGPSQVQLGVFFVDAATGLSDDTRGRVVDSGWEYYAGTLDDGHPYCFALSTWRNRPPSPPLSGEGDGAAPFGPCRWWARYGLPGEHVGRWLLNAGWAFASEDEGSLFVTRQLVFSRQLQKNPPLVSVLNGDWGHRVENMEPDTESCLQGDLAACRDLVLRRSGEASGVVASDPWVNTLERTLQETTGFLASETMTSRLAWRSLAVPFALLFADLRKEFGDDAMLRFWGDDRPVAEAFEASFGVEIGAWTNAWMLRYAEPTAGPRMTAGTLLLSLLTVLVAFALGFVAQHRRQVA